MPEVSLAVREFVFPLFLTTSRPFSTTSHSKVLLVVSSTDAVQSEYLPLNKHYLFLAFRSISISASLSSKDSALLIGPFITKTRHLRLALLLLRTPSQSPYDACPSLNLRRALSGWLIDFKVLGRSYLSRNSRMGLPGGRLPDSRFLNTRFLQVISRPVLQFHKFSA